MDGTHIHLLLNHFPIIGTLIATILLCFAVIRKNHSLRSASQVLMVAMALIAIPVYLSGEPAEESVEDLPGVSESLIESHEDAAKTALIALECAGALCTAAWFTGRKQHPAASVVNISALGVSIVACALMAYTGNLGGQIRHSEIRSGTAAQGASEVESEHSSEHNSEHSSEHNAHGADSSMTPSQKKADDDD